MSKLTYLADAPFPQNTYHTNPMVTNTTNAAINHRFNDDLLNNQDDLKMAVVLFPKLTPVLDFPELRNTFRKYEEEANRAKRRTHRWGLFAVACGAIGLLWTAATFLCELPPFGEVFGFVGILVGAGGLWLFSTKHQWLLCRLMTERLRQWHFQFILRRGDLVSKAIESEDKSAAGLASFTAERNRLFAEFLLTHEGKLDALLSALIGSEGDTEAWTVAVTSSPNHGYERGEVFDAVCEPYRTLRFRHQVQFAQHKLGAIPEASFLHFFRWPAIAQLRAFERLEGFCFVALIVVSALVVFGYVHDMFANKEFDLSPVVFGVVALCLAILAFAIRTIEQGLGLREEIGRLREYHSRMQRLLHDFDQTPDLRRRLRIMSDLELAAFDEMRHFLAAHHEAKFIL